MSRICFISYEIHPTTWGGCGVLLHHAAELLLQRGHEVDFLLDIPLSEFERFRDVDRLSFSNAGRCRAFHVDTLCAEFPWPQYLFANNDQWKALRFAHALAALTRQEPCYDYIEFFEYCGVAYYALVNKLFGKGPDAPVVGVRLHNSLELIDHHEATKPVDWDRCLLYGLEHGSVDLSECVLAPTETYFTEYYRDLYQLPRERVAISQSPKIHFAEVTRRPAKNGFKIVYFGRMFQFKGVDQYINAAIILLQQRQDIDCFIECIGYDSNQSPTGGSYIEYLRNQVPESLRERFIFTGHLLHDQVAEHLNDTLFAVFPNLFESFCYAVHEIYDAGVPVIVSDLPGWRDFFKHEVNALVYDGSTKGLVQAMARMIDEDELRERLVRPYRVAEQPLGDFYDRPRILSPLREEKDSHEPFEALVAILNDPGQAGEEATLASLAAQTLPAAEVVRLVPSQIGAKGAFDWLGGFWQALDRTGAPISALSIETRQGLLILKNGDRPDPHWLELCVGALRGRPKMAFAGTWTHSGGNLIPQSYDLVPEGYPFVNGCRLTRALHRTAPGGLLIDLFDFNLGSLGEIGYLWAAIGRWGRGCLLPEPLLETAAPGGESAGRTLDEKKLGYLLNRYGAGLSSRLPLLLGRAAGAGQDAPALKACEPTPAFALQGEALREYADVYLRFRDISHLAVRKLKRFARMTLAGNKENGKNGS